MIVSSSRGSKAGTLRYVGITDFASGIWAGVELDDPLGKNDGSVDGKRFVCCKIVHVNTSYNMVMQLLNSRFQVFRVRSQVRFVRPNRKGIAVAVESQAGRMRHSQQRARDADATIELARVVDVAGHVHRVVTRGGEAGCDVAGRAGRLAPRALGRFPLAAHSTHPAAAPCALALLRTESARQDAAHQARRV